MTLLNLVLSTILDDGMIKYSTHLNGFGDILFMYCRMRIMDINIMYSRNVGYLG